jgi:hypothetical protein
MMSEILTKRRFFLPVLLALFFAQQDFFAPTRSPEGNAVR